MGRKRDPGHHDHPIGNLGREPRPGNGLHLLRGRLMPPLGMWEVVGLKARVPYVRALEEPKRDPKRLWAPGWTMVPPPVRKLDQTASLAPLRALRARTSEPALP